MPQNMHNCEEMSSSRHITGHNVTAARKSVHFLKTPKQPIIYRSENNRLETYFHNYVFKWGYFLRQK